MKRRSFVKQSVSAAVLTPLAFSGLINAAGATGEGTENTTETTWFPETTTAESTPTHHTCGNFRWGTRYLDDTDPNNLFCWEEVECVDDGSNGGHYVVGTFAHFKANCAVGEAKGEANFETGNECRARPKKKMPANMNFCDPLA